MPKTELSDPDKRAKELHETIKNTRTKNSSTIAVLNTEEGWALVGSSTEILQKEVRDKLDTEYELPVKGQGHAEEKVIRKAKEEGFTPTEIGASRPICLDCENLINENNIEIKTTLKGKKSKNRQ